MTPLRKGAWLAAASAVCYGALAVLVKLAFGEGWNVPSLLTVRFGLAALCVAPFALRANGGQAQAQAQAQGRARGRGARVRPYLGAFLVGAMGYAGTTALYFPSIARLPAAVASFLLYLSPPLVAIGSTILFHERHGWRAGVGLVLALGGLALLAAGAFSGELSLAGVGLAAGSAVWFAGTVLASRRVLRDLAWPRATLGVTLGAFSSYLVFSLVTRQLAVPMSAPGFVYAFLIGTLATGVALSFFNAALPLAGASRTSIISTLEPVSTLVIGIFWIHEVPGPAGLAGGALILAAAVLVASE